MEMNTARESEQIMLGGGEHKARETRTTWLPIGLTKNKLNLKYRGLTTWLIFQSKWLDMVLFYVFVVYFVEIEFNMQKYFMCLGLFLCVNFICWYMVNETNIWVIYFFGTTMEIQKVQLKEDHRKHKIL